MKERTSHGLKRKEWMKGEGEGGGGERGERKKERKRRRRRRRRRETHHHHILIPMPRAYPDGNNFASHGIFSDTRYLLILITLSLPDPGTERGLGFAHRARNE